MKARLRMLWGFFSSSVGFSSVMSASRGYFLTSLGHVFGHAFGAFPWNSATCHHTVLLPVLLTLVPLQVCIVDGFSQNVVPLASTRSPLSTCRLACVASISVRFRSNEGSTNGIVGLAARKMEQEPKNERGAIFRAVFNSRSPFFAPDCMKTLATQAACRQEIGVKSWNSLWG